MTSAELACPSCGGELRFIAEYDRHYCNDCGHYAPEGFGAGGGLTCPKCTGVLSYVRDYERYYCHRDHEYMPEEFGREFDIDVPKPAAENQDVTVRREPSANADPTSAAPAAGVGPSKPVAAAPTLPTQPPKVAPSPGRTEPAEPRTTVVYGVPKAARIDPTGGRETASGRQGVTFDTPERPKPRAEPTKPSVPMVAPGRTPSGPQAAAPATGRKAPPPPISETPPKEVAARPEPLRGDTRQPPRTPGEPRRQQIRESATPAVTTGALESATLQETARLEGEATDTFREEAVAAPEPPRVANPCPTCGRELTYVAQYNRYYCRFCRAYAPPVKSRPAMPRRDVPACPTCGGDLTFIRQFERHYCYACKRYAPPFTKAAEKKSSTRAEARRAKANPCPTCGRPLRYVEQYRRYYCGSCRRYAPAQAKETCPNCLGALTWIPKYSRFYCYSCRQYPPAQRSETAVRAVGAEGAVTKVGGVAAIAAAAEARSATRSRTNTTIGLGVAATGSAMYVLYALFVLFPAELGLGPTPFVAFLFQTFGVLFVAIGMMWGLWALNSRK